jgi:hypothetical protein
MIPTRSNNHSNNSITTISNNRSNTHNHNPAQLLVRCSWAKNNNKHWFTYNKRSNTIKNNNINLNPNNCIPINPINPNNNHLINLNSIACPNNLPVIMESSIMRALVINRRNLDSAVHVIRRILEEQEEEVVVVVVACVEPARLLLAATACRMPTTAPTTPLLVQVPMVDHRLVMLRISEQEQEVAEMPLVLAVQLPVAHHCTALLAWALRHHQCKDREVIVALAVIFTAVPEPALRLPMSAVWPVLHQAPSVATSSARLESMHSMVVVRLHHHSNNNRNYNNSPCLSSLVMPTVALTWLWSSHRSSNNNSCMAEVLQERSIKEHPQMRMVDRIRISRTMPLPIAVQRVLEDLTTIDMVVIRLPARQRLVVCL